MKKSLVWGSVAVLLALAAAGAIWVNQYRAQDMPQNIGSANGRLEVGRIDIATKYAGRLQELLVREGDGVAGGQVLARLDTTELRAQLAAAQAAQGRADQAVARAQAETEARQARETLAQIELKQTQGLRSDALVSHIELQRRQLSLQGESAGLAAAGAALGEAKAAGLEAQAQIARVKSVIDDMDLRAPVAGRIEYRVVEVGAVLPAGGRVLTLLNTSDIYMTVFWPARVAGRLRVGQEARIVLDGVPGAVFPAKVGFVAAEAQFTPKYVETVNERDKLMYRVKLQVPVDLANRYATLLKGGMTGNGYVNLQADAAWPAELDISLPKE
ncbi:HlyD family secretion protein [Bordetella hinzii]|uniref:HlyD family secretion protein n=1 Tax=Bordetella hinzii TaxID=103855 RepID=A0AAN1RWC8_9BORD|nr:HlyD family efflux transporter periplasmic adaptor subunit [Bordetella hinzii]AKQ61759.1 Multidrug resistance protein MdtN [Bordetella hinzii]AZW17297.1 HlyD family secretion protein [Bordetella hinzii]KCB27200.1 efflux transporter, RND family, MFP subunit [Bordetella hinzii CA90 BAL1384]KCB52027.1 efflux transporter, RND family, MFP subunit [Bordetella hinzii 1277]MBZ0074676.1 HlyD family efflux transporter periplasmic adaptor subunit [Bordetella hinzii]